MPLDITTIISSQLIKNFVNKGTDSLVKRVKRKKEKIESELNSGFSIHIRRAFKFAENITLFKQTDSRKILKNSVHLNITNQDRRFAKIGSREIITEDDIINNFRNYILLGDVGAGKTTTLKRLSKKTFINIFSPNIEDWIFSFPIVIKLAEIKRTETFLTHICGQIGLKYKTITHKEIVTETRIKREEYIHPETGEKEMIEEEEEYDKTILSYEYKIGEYTIENALGEFLDEMNCIIFVDGLDEVHFAIKESVFSEIKQISQILCQSKMIITSRYISEISSFKQFDIIEICALTKNQKRDISLLWMKNADKFLRKLYNLPYADLSDRPLFLNYLILLFLNNNDQLPTQAIDVYRQIILLVIRDWDADKEVNIYRYSKYKTFDTYKKEDFLSDLTFELTYEQNVKKSFTHEQLKKAYLSIYKRYPGLKRNDSKEVLRDIESHTGLIIEVFDNNFEFSHLSLQEYLSARYIVSIPFSRSHFELLNNYPSPLAIANVISPRPAEWFAILFLENLREKRFRYQLDGDRVFEFIDRLIIEKIIFPNPKKELGFAIIYLKSKFNSHKLASKIMDFQKINYVLESLELAFKYYSSEKRNGKIFFEKKSSFKDDDLKIGILEKGSFNASYNWLHS